MGELGWIDLYRPPSLESVDRSFLLDHLSLEVGCFVIDNSRAFHSSGDQSIYLVGSA